VTIGSGDKLRISFRGGSGFKGCYLLTPALADVTADVSHSHSKFKQAAKKAHADLAIPPAGKTAESDASKSSELGGSHFRRDANPGAKNVQKKKAE